MKVLGYEVRPGDVVSALRGERENTNWKVLSVRVPGGTSIILLVTSYKVVSREVVLDAFEEVEVRRYIYGYSKAWVTTVDSIDGEFTSPPIFAGEAASAYLTLGTGQYKCYLETDENYENGTLVVMADGTASYFFPHWKDSNCIAYLEGQHLEREGWGLDGHNYSYAERRGGDYEEHFVLGIESIESINS